jgi:hypothetical protein
MANGWFLAKDLRGKKRPCTGHIFLIAGARFLALQLPLFSLYVLSALLSARQCLLFPSAVLAPLTSSFDLVVLPI